MGRTEIYACGESVSRRNSSESEVLFSLKQEAPVSIGGSTFTTFRKYFLNYGKLEHIHLFVSRDKVFSQEQVLQETIIIKVKKTTTPPDKVILSSSQSNGDFNSITEIELPYNAVVVGDEWYVFLPTNEEEIKTIQSINRYTKTLPEIGIRMKTGIIVDFRQWDDLCKWSFQGDSSATLTGQRMPCSWASPSAGPQAG